MARKVVVTGGKGFGFAALLTRLGSGWLGSLGAGMLVFRMADCYSSPVFCLYPGIFLASFCISAWNR